MKKIYSYVITNDSGFAPNPRGKYCTLACCKPVIRRKANIGDLVVGTGSVNNYGRDSLIYMMLVTEKMNFSDYHQEYRFKGRIDNIYLKGKGKYKQKQNAYHMPIHRKHDLSGVYVLVSNKFRYFGPNAVKLPSKSKKVIKKGPGHKIIRDQGFIREFVKWVFSKTGRKASRASSQSCSG